MSDNDHDWFDEHATAYLMDGLSADDRARLESHAADCTACAAKLAALQQMDQTMNTLFASAQPSAGFEQKIIDGLARPMRLPVVHVNPFVRRAAVAAAAMIVLGGFGYVASEKFTNGRWPTFSLEAATRVASSMRQIGQAHALYANTMAAREFALNEAFVAPTSKAEKWDFGGGTGTAENWVNWNGTKDGLLSNQSYSYGNADRGATFPATKSLGLSKGRELININTASPSSLEALQLEAMPEKQSGGSQSERQTANTNFETNAEIQPPASEREPAHLEEQEAKRQHNGYGQNPIVGVEKSLATASSQLSQSRLDQQQAETAARVGDEQNARELQKQRTVTDLVQDARELRDHGRNEESLNVLNQIQAIDPKNQFAAEAKAAMQDRVASNGSQSNAAFSTITEAPAASQPLQLKVIRNGTMDFVVDSFDSALLQVTAIVAEEGGYIGTTNSQKMPNGKVSGAITIRVAPDHLDVLVLKLRALGELKEQKITAEDVTKEYTDLASELRAAKAMEDRLLDLIKDGKGSIKDLLSAEKELGDWREKIEKITGQMNYYDNLVAMSTLQLTLTEKDIKTPALASQTETVDMGVETEDVEKARNDAISAVDEIKGRIVESELKQFDAGQLAGKIVADVSPDKAGPLIDHLKQLGTVSRLEIQRQEVTTDGRGNPVDADTLPPGLRVEQKDTRLTLSLYNLANVAPRQTANIELACEDVEASYHAILDRVAKAGGRLLSSSLNRPTPDQVTATVSFETKSSDADGVLMDVKQAGDVMQSSLTENTDTNNVTSSKRGFSVQLRSLASVNPREVRTLSVATADVPASYAKLLAQITSLKARVILSKLDNEQDGGSAGQNQTAGWLDFEVKRGDVDAVEHALVDVGDSVQRQILRSTDDQNTLDTKVQFKVGLHNAQLFPPHETWTLSVECGDVDAAEADVLSAASAAGGHVVDSTLQKEAGGKTTAHLLVDVPLDQSAVVVDRVKHEGNVRVIQSTKNPQADEGRLARCRLDVTITNPEAIVSGDRGLWGSIRAGLTTSVAGLLYSLQLIVIGLCFVGPWVAAIWVGWKVMKRRKQAA